MSSSYPITPPVIRLPDAPLTQDDVVGWSRRITSAIHEGHKLLSVRADDAVRQGTLGQRPGAMGTRRFYYATDTKQLYYDDGGWRLVGLNVYSVKAFGATGDGVTDDTANITTAWTAANGSPIYYPAGSYIDTAARSAVSGQIIFGDGIGKSIILNRHATIAWLTLPTTALEVQVYSLSVTGNKPTNGFRGIEVQNGSGAGQYHVLRELKITNQTDHGVRLGGPWKMLLANVRCASNTGDGFRIEKQVSSAVNPAHVTFDRCWSEGNGGHGFKATTPDLAPNMLGLLFINCTSILNTSNGYDVTNATDTTWISSYSAQEAGGKGINLSTSIGTTVIGGGFHNLTYGIDTDSSVLDVTGTYFNNNTSCIRVGTGTRGRSRNCSFNNSTNGIETTAGAFNWLDDPTTSLWVGITNRYTDTGRAIGPWSCHLSNSAGIAAAAGTGNETAVNTSVLMTWDTEQYDYGALHSTGANTGRITIPTLGAGRWKFKGTVTFPADTSGTFRAVYIYRNRGGAVQRLDVGMLPAGVNTAFSIGASAEDDAQDADYYELRVGHDAGGSLTMTAGVSLSHFEARRVGG